MGVEKRAVDIDANQPDHFLCISFASVMLPALDATATAVISTAMRTGARNASEPAK
jgi:hypothetical protein